MTADPHLAEDVPTGAFGGPRPEPRVEPWTKAEQARHYADLTAALRGWRDESEPARRDRERHWPPRTHTTTDRSAA
ncbi:hypothetical protein [Streptomyces ardesiacus]|uniref:hypothetical protein n=1 Tax=Streptomyces ardesiacus TaxID=285564 RepID=UPI00362C5BBD